MKKIMLILLLLTLTLGLTGCGATRDVIEKNQPALFPPFETKDINGTQVTDQIFAQHKLTLVNIWGSYCAPCKAELPDLQRLHQELAAEDIAVVGIVIDGEDNYQDAMDLILEFGITYPNLLPDENMWQNILLQLSGVPTTIFVNAQGEIVGEHVLGARTGDQFKKIINDRLTV